MSNKLSYRDELIIKIFNDGYTVKNGRLMRPDGKEVKQRPIPSGYMVVTLGPRNKRTYVRMHRIIAYSIHGEDIFKTDCVRHLNDVRHDNNVDNLSPGTYAQNFEDRSKLSRQTLADSGGKSRRKLSESQVVNLKRDRKSGYTYRQLCDKYGIAKSTISYIINNKTYR